MVMVCLGEGWVQQTYNLLEPDIAKFPTLVHPPTHTYYLLRLVGWGGMVMVCLGVGWVQQPCNLLEQDVAK